MTADQPQTKPRSRRLHVLWAIALTLLLGLGLFCWLVVVPVWRVRSALERISAEQEWSFGQPQSWVSGNPSEEIDRLGGPQKAARAIGLYLRMPRSISSERWLAVYLLKHCGSAGAPELLRALNEDEMVVRILAARSLPEVMPADEAVPHMIHMLEREIDNDYVVLDMCEEFGEMGPKAREAIPILEKIQRGSYVSRDAPSTAAEALKKIKTKQAKR
jgi:hypothetical protein